MRVFLYLRSHRLAVLITVLLLVGCVGCDLALPLMTSNIVDVGIQQSGVEHIATDEMSDETHALLEEFIPASGDALFEASYEKTSDDRWHLTERGREQIQALDQLLTVPLVMVHGAPDLGGQAVDLEQMLQAVEAGTVSEEQFQGYVGEMREALGKGSSDILAQQALSAALKEYARLGVDLSQKQMGYLLGAGGIMLGLATASMVLNILVSLVASRTGAQVGHDLRKRLFTNVVGFSDAEVSRFSAASLITRGTNDIQLIQNVTTMILRMVLYAPIVAIGGIVMVLYTNASLGWIIVVAIVVVMGLVVVLFKVTSPRFRIMQSLIDCVNRVAREMLTGIPVIRAFGREELEQERFDGASRKLMETQLFTNRAMSFMMPAMMLVMNLTSVAIVWFGGHYIQQGILQTGDLIAFITYSMVIIMGFLMIGMISIMLPRADVAASRVNEVLTTSSSIQDSPQAKELPLQSQGLSIEFSHVSFSYPGSSEQVLTDVSFKAEPGSTLAIIGGTGAGKSTILKLIERFYDVDSGAVLVNGCDIRQLSQASLRATLGYVPQKSYLFSGTIDTNVAYGCESMPEIQVEEALALAQASQFVSEKPEGAFQPIFQGGTNVSGGQRQRLCIARALAKEAQGYLFDDSFSALDYKTDAALRQRLATELPQATKIIVAQRIASIREADTIVVLKDGVVSGVGTHASLLEGCEQYRKIALSQLSEEELGMTGGVR